MLGRLDATPESRGISSQALLRFVRKLDRKGIPMHSLLVARGDDIILNAYWAPFTDKTLHRQNSVTKSFVTLAIGLLVEDGRLALSDKVIDYFPEAAEYEVPVEIAEQTVYDLLTMRTSFIKDNVGHWVKFKNYDRIKDYFTSVVSKNRGTLFNYDSRGSYILGVIAERLTGKPFVEYLKERLLCKIGFSEGACCIADKMGYSWSDSGLLCTAEDLYRVGRLIRNGGVYEGERLMDGEFLCDAVSKVSSSCVDGCDKNEASYGYGYLIWREIEGGFGFHGMGMQYMICIPEKDLYIVCNADTQGNDKARAIFLDMCEDLILEVVSDGALPENPEAHGELVEYCKGLELVALSGDKKSEIADLINRKEYVLGDNPMGIKRIRLCFTDGGGELIYENGQGVKTLPFGICKNVLTRFPEDGYDNMEIGEPEEGYRHPVAVSGAWLDGECFGIRAQAVGNALGSVFIRLGFRENRVSLTIDKTTNCFFNEYEGSALGYSE